MLQRRFGRAVKRLLICVCALCCCHAGIAVQAFAADPPPYIIKLDGDADALFRIWSVENTSADAASSNALLGVTRVTISSGTGVDYTVHYDGQFSEMAPPITEAISIPLDDRVILDVAFHFSELADNRFQGVPYQLEWIFESDGAGNPQIDMVGGPTLYSNLNINPGDTYKFSIAVENGAPPPLPPDDPDPPDPENPDGPDGSDSSDQSDQPDRLDRPKTPGGADKPNASGNLGDLDNPGGDKDTTPDTPESIQTGDYTPPAPKGASLPLLIISIGFLVCAICVFIRLIAAERKRQAGR